jgi:rhomboid family GlyGly-CTERM serine protease
MAIGQVIKLSFKRPAFNHVITPVTLLVLMFACFYLVPESAIRFDREAIMHGQWWRLITNIMTHSNDYHLLLNCASVALIWSLYGSELKIKLSTVVVLYTSIFVGFCLLFFSPTNIYVGFSGALYGIIVIAAYNGFKLGDKWSLGLAIIVIGRVIYQQIDGPSEELAVMIESRVAIESHAFGIVSAVLWIAVDVVYQLVQSKTAKSK